MPGPRYSSPISRLMGIWRRLETLPGGKWLFSRLVGRFAPYSGSIGANVVELKPGHALLELKERRAVRNHLNSIHAIALANLGELTSGLAQMSTITPRQRGIVTGLSIEYFKKARGTLLAESNARTPVVDGENDVGQEVTCDIRDTDGEVVARVTVHWRIGPIPDTRPNT